MTIRFVRALAAAALAATLCAPFSSVWAAKGPPSHNVAWLAAANDADISRAFSLARTQHKPVLLYWGATWCPPCNQLKATLFNRQDFAAEARAFVAVHVDGDLPGAQKLGHRFKVSGYPTLLLLNADGSEITRLPGEVEPAQVLALMQLGLAGGRPVKAVLADALAGKVLSINEWKLLAFYSWETGEEQLVPEAELPGVLAKLAAASPAADSETTTRLWLKALVASADDKSDKNGKDDQHTNAVKPDAALRARVQQVLNEPALARSQMDVITNSAADLVRALGGDAAPEHSSLVPAFDNALQRLAADASLSRGDRLTATISRIELARLGLPKDAVQVALPAPLLQQLQQQVARDEREIHDPYERQAVITEAAYALGYAGLWGPSDALLKANLARSHSPYYLMSQLGSNARKLGHKDEALKWYALAFDKSVGPATRLQWGASYLSALVDLAPQDAQRIEKTASTLFAEAGRDKAAFDGRSVHSMQRMGKKLLAWNADGKQSAAMQRLQAQLSRVCRHTDSADGQRAACVGLLKPKKAA